MKFNNKSKVSHSAKSTIKLNSLNMATTEGAHILNTTQYSYTEMMAALSWQMIMHTTLSGSIILANEQCRQKFQIPQIDGTRNIRSLIDPLYFLKLRSLLIEKKKVINNPLVLNGSNGETITLAVNAFLIEHDQSDSFLVWVMLDKSDSASYLKVIQEKNDQLEEINFQIERFLYSTSHDLRSPVASILGLVNLINTSRDLNEILVFAEKAKDSAERLDDLIKGLMTYSRANYRRLESGKIDMNSLIWTVIKSHGQIEIFDKLKFEVIVDQQTPFYSDEVCVKLILENLIENSINFVDRSKTTHNFQIKADCQPENTTLTVVDNGIGIAKQCLASIFNMFYRATEKSTGAGMGLFYVKQSLDRLHGSIEVESEIGFGTIFRVSIPNWKAD